MVPDAIKLTDTTPFALFRLPGEATTHLVAQKDIQLEEWTTQIEDGFVLAPFTSSKKSTFIRADIREENPRVKLDLSLPQTLSFDDDKTAYLAKATKFIQACSVGMNKIILSRKKQIPQKTACPTALFDTLKTVYPSAFVYLCYTPEWGLWIGATPEYLILCENEQCKTVALAGTKPTTAIHWTEKEKKEQELVSIYLRDIFQTHGISFEETAPETTLAGNVAHLKSTFGFNLPQSGLRDFINKLHPTPAVGGMPRQEALAFISKHEAYDRRLYTGYLGPVSSKQTQLFVNLRCAEVFQNGMELYVGSGITNSSIAEKEWEETELKAKTLLNVLEK